MMAAVLPVGASRGCGARANALMAKSGGHKICWSAVGTPPPPTGQAPLAAAGTMTVVLAVIGAQRSGPRRGTRAARRATAAAVEQQTATTEQQTVEKQLTPAPSVAPEPAPEPEKKAGGFFRRPRKSLEERLLDELADEREATSRLRAKRELQEVENTARIQELRQRVEKAEARKDALQERLEAVQKRKQELDQEAASLEQAYSAEEGKKWAPLISEQNTAIRNVVQVVERLKREESELTAQLAEYEESNKQIQADLKAAEDMCADYFSSRN